MAVAPVDVAEGALLALQWWASWSPRASQPSFLQKATSADSIKHWAGEGPYEDRGNYSASLLCFLLLQPRIMRSDVRSLGFIIFPAESRWDRIRVLGYWGPEVQKSGTGQDNHRANIVEWLLSHLAGHESEEGSKAARLWLQKAWNLMREWVDEQRFQWTPTRSDYVDRLVSCSGRGSPEIETERPAPTSTASSGSLISPAMRKWLGPEFPFREEFLELLRRGSVLGWYISERREFVDGGYSHIRQAFPGASSNMTRKLYSVICAQFEVWDADRPSTIVD